MRRHWKNIRGASAALALVCAPTFTGAQSALPRAQPPTANDNFLEGAQNTYVPLISPTFRGTTSAQALSVNGPVVFGGPAGAAPTMTGLGYQFHARRYATGTVSTGVNLSLLNVEGDNAVVTGAHFLNVLAVQNAAFGGPDVQGGRQAVQASVNQTAVTSARNVNRNYVGIYAGAYSSSGDGGSDLEAGAKGAYFGINPVCILNAGAINTLNCSAAEVNVAVKSGASTNYKSGVQIVQLPFDKVQGKRTDAALSISNQPGAVGWNDGILFGSQNGKYPIVPNGYLLRSSGPGVANVTITALGVIQTSNLAGTGNRPIFAGPTGTLVLTPPAVPASSTTDCTVGQQASDANYAYFCVATNRWKRAALSTF
ncbi:hypothetical protein [Methylobacterium sp. ARG-1]|uniref:hypothetical protein n=1 Tax=Methylobacterium sp. ARG-1 TaxID=1692501 RepID=UPI0011875E2E|nr:hypothetical protein [Methylobacterium sp. ARG-1]